MIVITDEHVTDARVALVALDLDGTVLDGQFRMHADTCEAIQRAAVNVPIVLVTGRMWAQTAMYANALGICSASICGQGAMTYDSSGTLQRRRTLPKDVAKKVIQMGRTNDWDMLIYLDGNPYAEHLANSALRFVDVPRGDVQFVHDATALLDIGCEKVVCISESVAENTSVMRDLRMKADETCRVVGGSAHLAEIVNADATKCTALAALCTAMCIRGEHVMAIGDSDTDAEMFEFAKISVAVETAPDYVKKKARVICARPEDAGVAEVLRYFRLCE